LHIQPERLYKAWRVLTIPGDVHTPHNAVTEISALLPATTPRIPTLVRPAATALSAGAGASMLVG